MKLVFNDIVYSKIRQLAYFESEIELGVNPKSCTQAHRKNISEENFGYLNKVIDRVQKKLSNPDWVKKAEMNIGNKFIIKSPKEKGIRFNDELFKAGRGILKS